MAMPWILAALAVAMAAFAMVQWLPSGRVPGGRWFLFGTDTIHHDAIAHLWVQQQFARGTTFPLWVPELLGGIPAVGAFFWTPFAPPLWGLAFLEYPEAQRLAWGLTFAIGGWGGLVLASALRLRRPAALLLALSWMLSQHFVTLVHVGHTQKAMALAWMGWGLAGAVMVCRRPPRARLAGAALGGGAGGMMFLSGHPQVAYALAALQGALVASAAVRRAPLAFARRTAAPALAIPVIAVLLGGAQLLPGIGMGALSNRAGGVDFAEATATSHPPRELFEFLAPRFLGSSTRADAQYLGTWNERIISDYAGSVTVMLAFAALFAPGARGRTVWFFAGAAAVSMLVGAGHHTPVYRALHALLPGFASFRSPATFHCIAAIAIPVLAAVSADRLLRQPRAACAGLAQAMVLFILLFGLAIVVRRSALGQDQQDAATAALVRRAQLCMTLLLLVGGALSFGAKTMPRRMRSALLAAVALGSAADLAHASRAFLHAEPWERFSSYLAPTPVDLAIRSLPEPRREATPGRELSLRPMLLGIDVLNGYHPIEYQAKTLSDRALTLHSDAWRAQWGVMATLEGGQLRRLPYSPVRAEPAGALARWRYTRPDANSARLDVTLTAPARVEVAEMQTPGWHVSTGGVEEPARGTGLTRTVDLPAGTHTVHWHYRPILWRVGLAMSAAGLCAVLGLLAGALWRRSAEH
jgi:hypothetical protein